MERSIQAAEVEREQALAIAEQDREIVISAKSQEESRAQAEADTARAEAVKASEALVTVRAMAEPNVARNLRIRCKHCCCA